MGEETVSQHSSGFRFFYRKFCQKNAATETTTTQTERTWFRKGLHCVQCHVEDINFDDANNTDIDGWFQSITRQQYWRGHKKWLVRTTTPSSSGAGQKHKISWLSEDVISALFLRSAPDLPSFRKLMDDSRSILA